MMNAEMTCRGLAPASPRIAVSAILRSFFRNIAAALEIADRTPYALPADLAAELRL